MCGVTGADPKSVMTKPTVANIVNPQAELVQSYDDAYADFANAYPKLKAMP